MNCFLPIRIGEVLSVGWIIPPGKSCRLAEFLWVSVASGDNRPEAQSRSLNVTVVVAVRVQLCGEKSEKSAQRLNAMRAHRVSF